VLDKIADRTSPRRANRYLALLKKLFNWCAERDNVEASPAANIKPLAREVSRDRVLSDDELQLVWRCCEAIGWPFGDLFRLLILTAQRLGEVSTMRWRDVDLDAGMWTVPSGTAKNGVANEVPLSPASVAILTSLPPLGKDLYFPHSTALPTRYLVSVRRRRGWTKRSQPSAPRRTACRCNHGGCTISGAPRQAVWRSSAFPRTSSKKC
jgi:integrase